MKKLSLLALLLCITWGGTQDIAAQNVTAESVRMDRTRLNIGAYHLQPYAWSEAHVRDVAECGIDFLICIPYNKELLDRMQKHHVGAIVSGIVPGWWGGDGKNAGTMEKACPLVLYDEKAKNFVDHPAIWGIDIGDEPSALDFPHYGRVFQRVDSLFPNQFPYLNLYPNYASVSQNSATQTVNQLGTPTYREHIAEYCRNVPADYLCYDFYLYSINVPKAYDNLSIVSDACTGTGRSMWIVLQVNSNKEDKWISENELRFQAYTAMAFGAENITWACYTAGWWHNQVLDKKGEKTQQYDKLRRVNAELHRLGPSYMKYRRVRTDFVSFDGTEWLKGVRLQSLKSFSNGVFDGLCCTDHSSLVVGTMLPRTGNGNQALFVCSADDPYDEHPTEHTLSFHADGWRISATGGDGPVKVNVGADGTYSIAIRSNQGILIEAEAL